MHEADTLTILLPFGCAWIKLGGEGEWEIGGRIKPGDCRLLQENARFLCFIASSEVFFLLYITFLLGPYRLHAHAHRNNKSR